MIITNEKDGTLSVPCTDGLNYVIIPPATSEIDDALWASARSNAMRFIDAGVLKEEWIKVDAGNVTKDFPLVIESDDVKETTKRRVPCRLKDIDRKGQRLQRVIKGTYHIPTLEKWLDEELRQDARLDIQHQIKGVNEGTIKG